MKRIFFCFAGLFLMSLPLWAHGGYFDIGIGVGSGKTEFNNEEITSSSGSDIGVEVGLKVGFAPLSYVPLFIVGELSGIGHRVESNLDTYQFNSYLMGGGILFYPLSYLQFGGSAGYSLVMNTVNNQKIDMESTGGFAWNVYGSLDLGSNNSGILLGVRYFEAINTLDNGFEQKNTMVSGFIKYAYRHKISKDKDW